MNTIITTIINNINNINNTQSSINPVQLIMDKIMSQYSVASLNNFFEIESVLCQVENNFGQLSKNWFKSEREQLKTVYNWLNEHDYDDCDLEEVTKELKTIAMEIESEVKKNLIGQITVSQLASLLK